MERLTKVRALARVGALLALYSLDVLDLYGKVAWVGPTESFSFQVEHEFGFEQKPLPRPEFLVANASNVPLESGAQLLRASGWTSIYEKCSELYATTSGHRFHMIKAIDCNLGTFFATEMHLAGELILSASVRPDSVAWVCCQLLFFHRRPPLCQENLVTLFPQRYLLPEGETSHETMAPINSMAEAELLKMLNLLSRSHPMSNVVCVQGFESTPGPGHYDAVLFACGSPNAFETAFVGVYARTFAELHEKLSWLAVDKLNIMGFELVTRQNLHSEFKIREEAGKLVVVEKSFVNFTSFGHLYVVLVVVEIFLLIANARAAFETGRMFGWRPLLGFDGNDITEKQNWMLLYRSLYQSSAIAALTILSSILSWLVGFPFAYLWCYEANGKEYAVLSVMRVWMFVLCLVNMFWGVLVRLSERRAYNVVKCTFVTPLEVLMASSIGVVFELFSVAEVRRQLDDQQVIDRESFSGRLAIANAYSEELDGFATTSPRMVHELFAPLEIIVVESLLVIALVLMVKFVFYRRRILLEERDSASSVAVVDFDNIDEHVLADRRAEQHSSAPLLTHRRAKLYNRLPLEELLGVPARANSLVRGCFEIDMVEEDDLTYMLPHVYYSFGILVNNAGFLRTRRSFCSVLHRRLDVERFFTPLEDAALSSSSPSKRQRIGGERATGRTKFALSSVPSPVDTNATAQGSPSPPRTRSEFRPAAMSRSMRRRKSMEDLLDNTLPNF